MVLSALRFITLTFIAVVLGVLSASYAIGQTEHGVIEFAGYGPNGWLALNCVSKVSEDEMRGRTDHIQRRH